MRSVKEFDWQGGLEVISIETSDEKVCVLNFSSRISEVLHSGHVLLLFLLFVCLFVCVKSCRGYRFKGLFLGAAIFSWNTAGRILLPIKDSLENPEDGRTEFLEYK